MSSVRILWQDEKVLTMRRNIELKAMYPDLQSARRICAKLGAAHIGVDRQLDSFFKVTSGRLKLRESSLTGNSLIFYMREDKNQPKQSDYMIFSIHDNATVLRELLARALGLFIQLSKTRDIYLYHATRIHLDEVDSLGTFVEFEYVLSETDSFEKGLEDLGKLKKNFDIHDSSLVDVSYSDLLIRQHPTRQMCQNEAKEEGPSDKV